ncbi:MAG: rhomboid family intramembrane serine protease [Roseovarius sp.]
MSNLHDPAPQGGPVNPIPPLVLAIVAAMAAAEAVFQLGARGMVGGPEAIGWRIATIQQFGFSNRAMTWMLETGQLRIDYLIRFVTYPFVHASLLQAVFAIVMTLAIGKFVAERMAGWAVAILFFASSIFGALVFGLIYPDGPGLIGGFPGVYGLIGGFTCLVWLRLGVMGENQMRAFVMIGVLLGLQLFFGLLYGNNFTWVADIGGFAGGFVLSFVLVPGGLARLRQKLRQR